MTSPFISENWVNLLPNISVLMPARNAGRFISRAIISTLRALPNDAELVVLDDGSSDSTVYQLEKISDKRFRYLVNTEGQGVSNSLNQLLASTDSRYVARMDADDISLPWRFRVQMAAMDKSDISFTNVVFINEEGRPKKTDPTGRMSSDAVPWHLLLGNVLVHPTMFAQRQAIESLGGYRAMASEDYDLWLRAASQGLRLSRSGVPGLLYRIHGGQVSGSNAWRASSVESMLLDSYSHLLAAKLHRDFSVAKPREWTTAGLYSTMTQSELARFEAAIVTAGKSLSPRERLVLFGRRRKRLSNLKLSLDL